MIQNQPMTETHVGRGFPFMISHRSKVPPARNLDNEKKPTAREESLYEGKVTHHRIYSE